MTVPEDAAALRRAAFVALGTIVRLAAAMAGLSAWRRWSAAFGLGLLSAAALPPLTGVVLLIPSFTGLLWLLGAKPSRRAAAATGWWFGFGHFTAGLYWIGTAFLVDADVYGWMAPFAVAGLAAGLAVFSAAAATVLSARRLWGLGRVLVFAAAWTALEWLRGWVLTGFPWNLIGTAWIFSEPMIQAASVIGAYGLSLVTVAAAAMPAILGDAEASQRQRAAALLGVAALLGALYAGGVARLSGAAGDAVAGVRLRLVQPAIPQSLKWNAELRWKHVLDQIALSTRPPAGPAPSPYPTHIIWAETAVPFYLSTDRALSAQIGSVAPAQGMVIVGAPRTDSVATEPLRAWNSLHAIDDGGQIVATYDKAHLVPFGEYVPLRGILDFLDLTQGRGDFSSGKGPVTLRIPGLPPTSPLICYEIIFPGKVVDAADRPGWMLNLTNDAWFGLTSGPYQHFASARLRTVEEGLPLVRAANSGISAVVDAYGRVVVSLGLGRRGVIDSDLPVALARPPLYARWGAGIVFILLAGTAAAGWAASRRKPPLPDKGFL